MKCSWIFSSVAISFLSNIALGEYVGPSNGNGNAYGVPSGSFTPPPSGPYPPSGWKPAGRRLLLPGESRISGNGLDSSFGTVPSQYGPATVDSQYGPSVDNHYIPGGSNGNGNGHNGNGNGNGFGNGHNGNGNGHNGNGNGHNGNGNGHHGNGNGHNGNGNGHNGNGNGFGNGHNGNGNGHNGNGNGHSGNGNGFGNGHNGNGNGHNGNGNGNGHNGNGNENGFGNGNGHNGNGNGHNGNGNGNGFGNGHNGNGNGHNGNGNGHNGNGNDNGNGNGHNGNGNGNGSNGNGFNQYIPVGNGNSNGHKGNGFSNGNGNGFASGNGNDLNQNGFHTSHSNGNGNVPSFNSVFSNQKFGATYPLVQFTVPATAAATRLNGKVSNGESFRQLYQFPPLYTSGAEVLTSSIDNSLSAQRTSYPVLQALTASPSLGGYYSFTQVPYTLPQGLRLVYANDGSEYQTTFGQKYSFLPSAYVQNSNLFAVKGRR